MGPALAARSLSPTLALVLALAALALGACSSAAAGASGCDQTILGTAGRIRPESSGMNCRQIKEFFIAIPPDSKPLFTESPVSGRLWKCRGRGNRATGPLMRCELGAARFSILAVR